MNFTFSEPSVSVQLIGAGLAFAIVALIALAAKLAAVVLDRDEAQRAALAIQADRDQYLKMLEIEGKVSGKLKAERERLAAEVGELTERVNALKADVALLNLRDGMVYDALVVACESVSLPASERKRNPMNGLFMPNDPNYTASVIYERVRKAHKAKAFESITGTMNQLKYISETPTHGSHPRP